MGDNSKATKVTVVVVICNLLIAAMVVLLLSFNKKEIKKPSNDGNAGVSTSQKAISDLCSNTDYNQTCVKTLESANTSDPKQLIQAAFAAAVKEISAAMEKSAVLDKIDDDARGKAALESCRELARRASADLERSFDKMKQIDLVHVDAFLADLQIWLSGAVTYQETCLDGFEGVQNDSGEKMRGFLKMSMEMSSNALAMVTAMSTFVTNLITGQIQNVNSRRLLSDADRVPTWLLSANRRLFQYDAKNVKPNLVVAKDGSGDYRTIMEALVHVPKKSNNTFVLYIKEGVYQEKVHINKTMKYLVMVGDGPTKTKITGSLNFIDGTNTYQTATVAVQADHFTAVNIGFENSADAEKHQAVALRVSGDMAVFYNCQMDGYQDTLYAHTYRQFYRDCLISGTIDFIFGDSAATFQNCKLVVRKPLQNQQCIVTAQGRKDIRQPTGIVLQNCSFVADSAYFPLRTTLKSFLGRPWKEYSRTIIMESFIDDLIAPEGWLPWEGDFGLRTLLYVEYKNRGPGSAKAQRLKWEGVKELPRKRVKRFTADEFLEGKKWIPATKVPYEGGFMLEEVEDDPDVSYSPVSPSEVEDRGKMAERDFVVSPPTSSTISNSTSSDQDKDKEKEKEKEKEKKKKEKETDDSSNSLSPTPTANAPTPTSHAQAPDAIPRSSVVSVPAPVPIPRSSIASAPVPVEIPRSSVASAPSVTPRSSITSAPSLADRAPSSAAFLQSPIASAPSLAAKAPSPEAILRSHRASAPSLADRAPISTAILQSPIASVSSLAAKDPNPAVIPRSPIASAPSLADRAPNSAAIPRSPIASASAPSLADRSPSPAAIFRSPVAGAPVPVSQIAAAPSTKTKAPELSPVSQPLTGFSSVKKFHFKGR